MLGRITTLCFQGLEATPIDVQVQLANGLPAFSIVGLPDKALAESKERVRGALFALGIAMPAKRITVNLAPADLQKEGSHYDLPIALALLGTLGALSKEALWSFVALGELGLDGSLISTGGILSASLFASQQQKGLICPFECGPEAAWAGDLQIIASKTLLGVINHLKGTQVLAPPTPLTEQKETHQKDLQEVKGQHLAKRALEVTAAGGHNLLMIGPPGAGKSMLAERLPTILPPLSPVEALEATMIHSMGGRLKEGRLLKKRPFRNPHHSASMAALIGGGLKGKPGEISLAHRGILFLDELPEFNRALLEALRQPLESGEAVIARANVHITYPARVQLIAAMNPCACGYLGHAQKQCRKAPLCAERYQNRLSGPLLDRLDLFITMQALSPFALEQTDQGTTSQLVAQRVAAAWAIQKERHSQTNHNNQPPFLNAQVPFKDLERHLHLDNAASKILQTTTLQWGLSARSYHKVLRLARTIADLANSTRITKLHASEALSYRMWPFKEKAA